MLKRTNAFPVKFWLARSRGLGLHICHGREAGEGGRRSKCVTYREHGHRATKAVPQLLRGEGGIQLVHRLQGGVERVRGGQNETERELKEVPEETRQAPESTAGQPMAVCRQGIYVEYS
eukprot:1039576-Prorocentrum_minimum.AAC.2